MKDYKPKMAENKRKAVGKIVELTKKYSIVGLVDMNNFPAPQVQKLRSKLRDTLELVMTKKKLMKVAFDIMKSEKKGIDELCKHFEGMPALVLSNQNPFKISNLLQKNKSSAPAKPNQIAPFDIVIPAGPTPFPPGPIISELGMVGIKTGVEGGKVVVKADCVVAKKGEKIKPKVADVLSRLSIHPMELGLNLIAVYDNGLIYEKEILSITQEEYLSQIVKASAEANVLAVEISYITKDNIEQLIINAHISAEALAKNQNIQVDSSTSLPHEAKKDEKKKEYEEEIKKIRTVKDAVSEDKAEKLLEQLEKAGTLRKPAHKTDTTKETKKVEKKAEDVDLSMKKIEELAKEVTKKGTLRGKGGK